MNAVERTRTQLDALAAEVLSDSFSAPSGTAEWGGADIVISAIEPRRPAEDAFYPEPRYVVTPDSLELSHLFEKLRDIFEPHIDFSNKAAFYGRLADAATGWQNESSPAGHRKELLAAVLEEARSILSEIAPKSEG